jgi:hypothetical protein
MTLLRDDMNTARIVCANGGRPRCYICGALATILCDYPDLAKGHPLETCSRPCCKTHARYWTRYKDVCQEHAQQLGCW